jgi:hypothetical protein
MPQYAGINLVWSKGITMTNQQPDDKRITLVEMLEIIITTIREYEGETGIFRNHNKKQ